MCIITSSVYAVLLPYSFLMILNQILDFMNYVHNINLPILLNHMQQPILQNSMRLFIKVQRSINSNLKKNAEVFNVFRL